MARINSRVKGATFERSIAKSISAWWGCVVRRTPLSGGWGAAVTAGDTILLPPEKDDPDFETKFRRYRDWPFSVECKHHKDFTIDALFRSPSKSPLGKFLSQCKKSAKKENRVPLLIAKKNFSDALAFIVLKGVVDFGTTDCVGVVKFGDCFVHVMRFETLLEVDPDDLLVSLNAVQGSLKS